MNKLLFFCLLSMAVNFCHAQETKHDYNWTWSRQSTPSNWLNFDNQLVTVSSKNLTLYQANRNTTMSSAEGDFLFYSNDCHINDSDNQQITNGLLNDNSYNSCESSTWYNGLQGSICLPVGLGEYLMAHQQLQYFEQPFWSISPEKIMSTTVSCVSQDCTVPEQNTAVASHRYLGGYMTACRQ